MLKLLNIYYLHKNLKFIELNYAQISGKSIQLCRCWFQLAGIPCLLKGIILPLQNCFQNNF